ncbi:MAG: phosphoribosylglycinamide formyltransferase, partial [Deltaproteobacteria bacterium]|nr:phosphoribosylglycinamide formyltransferase [Deltaproteobacteria bacterium]
MAEKKIRIGALISGGGTNLQAIIDACESNAIDAEMVFVGSANPSAGGLERAEKKGIPTFVVDYPAIIKKVRETPAKALLPDDCDLVDLTARQYLVAG